MRRLALDLRDQMAVNPVDNIQINGVPPQLTEAEHPWENEPSPFDNTKRTANPFMDQMKTLPALPDVLPDVPREKEVIGMRKLSVVSATIPPRNENTPEYKEFKKLVSTWGQKHGKVLEDLERLKKDITENGLHSDYWIKFLEDMKKNLVQGANPLATAINNSIR